MAEGTWDNPSFDLLSAFQSRYGLDPAPKPTITSDTRVASSAAHIAHNAIDVFISMDGTKAAARQIHHLMTSPSAALGLGKYTPATASKAWHAHPLHPTVEELGVEGMIQFIFTMDLLNFCFWSEKSAEERFSVYWRGKSWTGYSSLVAGLRRALEDGIPITSPSFWIGEEDDEPEEKAPPAEETVVDGTVSPSQDAAEKPVDGTKVDQNSEQTADDTLPTQHESQQMEEETAQAEPKYTTEETTNPIVEPEPHPQTSSPLEQDPQSHPNSEPPIQALDSLTLNPTPSLQSTQIPTPTTPIPKPKRKILTLPLLRQIFHSETNEQIPLLESRLNLLHETGRILTDKYNSSILTLLESADNSAGKLVNILARDFPAFRDETVWEDEKVRFLKRAQIFVADIWACFGGEGVAGFEDIECITAFADYRIPQMLYTLGAIYYSPPLETRIRRGDLLESCGDWEVQIRGCSIRSVELIRLEIEKIDPQAKVYPLLIDFFLYDWCKRREAEEGGLEIEHHRVRSIWY